MIEAVLIGVLGGLVAGLTGIGGGALFVPALAIGLGLSHVEAEATSLLAIIPVALVGAWRQHGHGNADVRTGLTLGALAAAGAVLGAAIANSVPQRALQVGFALFILAIAASLAREALNNG